MRKPENGGTPCPTEKRIVLLEVIVYALGLCVVLMDVFVWRP